MGRFPLALITDEFCQDFERAAAIAVELGFAGLEVRTAWDKNIADMSDDETARLRRAADQAGLRILSIASPVFKCTHPEGGAIDHRFEQDAFHSAHAFADQARILERSLEVAAALGAGLVRVFSFWRSVEPQRLFGRIVESLARAVDRAAGYGLRIGLENEHACNIATAEEAAPLLRALNEPGLGLVWDPGNAYMAGESPFPHGYSLLSASRIIHVHAKDGLRDPAGDRVTWGPLGEGDIDWRGQIQALARDGYRGAISLETHWGGPGGRKEEGSRMCAARLKEMVEACAP
ncbi:MAG: sugar phosphate isomerase/epimerase [Acidobacteria bacterium]|nr:sugar phosphate isomerase/epimerase [Acidobacteriota bacterium]